MVDITNLDERSKADEGVWTDMLHPETLDVLQDDDGNVAQMLIFGQAGRVVQDKLHKIAKNKASKKDDEPQSMKKAHETLVESALVYIGGFRNLTAGDDDLSDVSNARRVLDMTFPRMEVEEGSALSVSGPKFKMANKPFALQAIEAASKQGKLLGND